jgi:hypothetical protein
MMDEVITRILGQSSASELKQEGAKRAKLSDAQTLNPTTSDARISVDDETNDSLDRRTFDEARYLELNPDVAASIAIGEMESGYWHFLHHGFREGRPTGRGPNEPRNKLLHLAGLDATAPSTRHFPSRR